MPRQVFTAGEILTAANLNDVSDATVMVFDDATARTTAIPTPVEGMVTYLEDVGGAQGLEVFDGAVFTPVAIEPDPPAILQVVSVTKTDVFTTAASTLQDVTGLTLAITPSSASSKVLVLVSLALNQTVSNAGSFGAVLRGSTVIGGGVPAGTSPAGSFFFRDTTTSLANGAGLQHYNFLDTPNTTASTTYKVQVSGESGGTTTVNRSTSNGALGTNFPRLASTITLMEVAG